MFVFSLLISVFTCVSQWREVPGSGLLQSLHAEDRRLGGSGSDAGQCVCAKTAGEPGGQRSQLHAQD